VLAFDRRLPNRAGAADFRVLGNAFAGSAEPGIVAVACDDNGNGLADDPWYELAGSEHARATPRYTICYRRPAAGAEAVAWSDSEGRRGALPLSATFPPWAAGDTLTFCGTLLPPNAVEVEGRWSSPPFAYGYADSYPNGEAGACFDIGWAVDGEGRPAALAGIDFVKVYTGVSQALGVLGEASTELGGVEGVGEE
ncbi:MAG: PKD domain-containing protein, partial [Prevotellaceae bacterium]|jgi:hypothetical protein|nr:PKD domain-containing protein [Prevotellaceae bacterium]